MDHMESVIQHRLAKTLRTTEYFALAFGTMVGVGWLILIDDWLLRGGPLGAMLGFLIGGISLIPVAFIYGRFVREIPDAGTELTYAGKVFPRSVSFFAGWLMTLAYLIVCPWEAVAIGRLAAYIFPSVQSAEMYRVGAFPVYLPTLLLGLAATALVLFLNYRGIRLSSRFQNYTTFGLLFLFALFTLVGFTRIDAANYQPFFSADRQALLSGSLVSVILVLQIVPYFLTGFESVPKCSEEADENFDREKFSRAIFLGLGAGVLFYVLIIFVVSGLVPWQSLTSERFATAVAFERAFGTPWFSHLIIFAALISLFKVFNANFLTASRLVYALGRQGFLHNKLAGIHPVFQSPANAVLFCAAFTVLGALLGSSILIPVTEVGSMCSAFGWSITAVAFIRWKKGSETDNRYTWVAWLGFCVASLFLLLKFVPVVPGSFRKWEYLALLVWLALGLILQKRRP